MDFLPEIVTITMSKIYQHRLSNCLTNEMLQISDAKINKTEKKNNKIQNTPVKSLKIMSNPVQLTV